MGIGGGITLIVLGLILVMGVVQIDLPYVNEYALGIILVLGGITAITLMLTVWRDRGRIVERRIVRDPGRPFL